MYLFYFQIDLAYKSIDADVWGFMVTPFLTEYHIAEVILRIYILNYTEVKLSMHDLYYTCQCIMYVIFHNFHYIMYIWGLKDKL